MNEDDERADQQRHRVSTTARSTKSYTPRVDVVGVHDSGATQKEMVADTLHGIGLFTTACF